MRRTEVTLFVFAALGIVLGLWLWRGAHNPSPTDITAFWRRSLPAAQRSDSRPRAKVEGRGVHLEFDHQSGALATTLSTTQLRRNGRIQPLLSQPVGHDEAHFSRDLGPGITEHIHCDAGRAEIAWLFDTQPVEKVDIDFELSEQRYRERSISGYHFVDTQDSPSFRVGHAFLVDSLGESKPVLLEASGHGLMASLSPNDFAGLQFPVALDPVIEAEVSAGAAVGIGLGSVQNKVTLSTMPTSPSSVSTTSVALWEDFRNGPDPELRLARIYLPEGHVGDASGRLVAERGEDADIDCNALLCAIAFKSATGLSLSTYDAASDEIRALPPLTLSATAQHPRVMLFGSHQGGRYGVGLVAWDDSDGLHLRPFDAGLLGEQSLGDAITGLVALPGGAPDLAQVGGEAIVSYGLGGDVYLYRFDSEAVLQQSNILGGLATTLTDVDLSPRSETSFELSFIDQGTRLSTVSVDFGSLGLSSPVVPIVSGNVLTSLSAELGLNNTLFIAVQEGTTTKVMQWTESLGPSQIHLTAAGGSRGALRRGHGSDLIFAYDDGADVFFRGLGENGLVGSQRRLSGFGLNQRNPGLAAQTGEYLVVWTEHNANTNQSLHYRGRRFAADGSALEAEPHDLFDMPNYLHQGSRDGVVAGADGYLVMAMPAWAGAHTSKYRVFHNNAWQAVQDFPTSYSLNPRAASDGTRYLALWGFEDGLTFQFIHSDGSLDGASFTLNDPGGLIPKRPGIVHDGSRYIVVYAASDASNQNDRCLRGIAIENDGQLGAVQTLSTCLDGKRELIPKLSAAGEQVLLSYVAQNLANGNKWVQYMGLNDVGAALYSPKGVGSTAHFYRGHAGDGVSHALSALRWVGGWLKPVVRTVAASAVLGSPAKTWTAWTETLDGQHHYEHELASDEPGRFMMAYRRPPAFSGGSGFRIYLKGLRFGDGDGDGHLEHVDNCPSVANVEQADVNGDGVGDICSNDFDGDGIVDGLDNCMIFANAGQQDSDEDGLGDACAIDFDGDGQLEGSLAALDPNSYIGAKEICDGKDNDGDGGIDEGTGCEVCE